MAIDPVERRRVWEDALPTLTGRAWAFGMQLAAADVLPPRFAAASAADARAHLFADVDATLAARLAPGDVIVAEEQRGGPGIPHAVAALAAAGVIALVARRFDAGVAEAALAAGIVAVTLDAPAFIHTGDRVRIDLDAAKIVNLSSGDRAAIRNLDDASRAAVAAMLAQRAGVRR